MVDEALVELSPVVDVAERQQSRRVREVPTPYRVATATPLPRSSRSVIPLRTLYDALQLAYLHCTDQMAMAETNGDPHLLRLAESGAGRFWEALQMIEGSFGRPEGVMEL